MPQVDSSPGANHRHYQMLKTPHNRIPACIMIIFGTTITSPEGDLESVRPTTIFGKSLYHSIIYTGGLLIQDHNCNMHVRLKLVNVLTTSIHPCSESTYFSQSYQYYSLLRVKRTTLTTVCSTTVERIV